ncbi:MAG TPA: hypothetical protein VI306_26230 [Pyrinomonadaceae bacterium]
MKNNLFRVLLLDDNSEVLKLLKNSIQPDALSMYSVTIDVSVIHVVLEKLPGGEQYEVAPSTLHALAEVCTESFDYIFSDFSFIGDDTQNEKLREKLLDENRRVRPEDIQKFVLHLNSIKKKFAEMKDTLSQIQTENISDNFFDHKGEVLVYTNSPEPFDSYFIGNELRTRRNEIIDVFKAAHIENIFLMHYEFGITPDFERLFHNSTDRKTHHSLVLSKKIESLILFSAMKQIVADRGKWKNLNTIHGFKKLTAIGVGFGALIALLGEVMWHCSGTILRLAAQRLEWTNIFELNILINILLLIICAFVAWMAIPRLAAKVAMRTDEELGELVK